MDERTTEWVTLWSFENVAGALRPGRLIVD